MMKTMSFAYPHSLSINIGLVPYVQPFIVSSLLTYDGYLTIGVILNLPYTYGASKGTIVHFAIIFWCYGLLQLGTLYSALGPSAIFWLSYHEISKLWKY